MDVKLKDQGLLRAQAFVAGAWIDADAGETFAVTDPATGDHLGDVPRLGAAETGRAIDAADAAQRASRGLTAAVRGAWLLRMAELMQQHRDDLALLMTREQGKPLAEAGGEVDYAASFLRWFGEEARRNYGKVIPSPRADSRIVVVREPVGVCAGITPWNFPLAMITRKLGPALAAGCALVIKPAESTPLSALALAELGVRAGIPEGLFSVVTGDREDAPAIGGELTGNRHVRKLSFTGSTPVGKRLAAQCAGRVMRVSLELGGNAPFLVFDDADLDAAVAGLMVAKFRNAGQTCVAANRVLVQEGVHDAFVEKLAAQVQSLKVAPGLEPGSQIGPLIDGAAIEKVQAHVADATGRGAKLVLGGKPHALGHTFYEPTLLSGVEPGMTMAREETFGPVAGVGRFSTEDEALALANDTDSGLAAYFYSRDVGRVWRVSEGLEYGMVGAHPGLVSTEVAPFGGVKESGQGREGSSYGLEDWTEPEVGPGRGGPPAYRL